MRRPTPAAFASANCSAPGPQVLAQPRADTVLVSGSIVQRWTRCGHDRLYVRPPAGDRLGYWGAKTGTTVLQAGADQATLDIHAHGLSRHYVVT